MNVAKKKRNDPLALTTEQNLRRTRQNAKLKIQRQIKFSKRNDLQFQAPGVGDVESPSLEFDLQTCQQTKDTQRDTHLNSTQVSMYRVDSRAPQLSQAGSVSVPEGVAQIKVPNKYLRPGLARGSV